jgi:hypothetical protein
MQLEAYKIKQDFCFRLAGDNKNFIQKKREKCYYKIASTFLEEKVMKL